MTQSEHPGNPLTLEQWRSVQDLTASPTAAQVLWLNGYFTGLDADSRSPCRSRRLPKFGQAGHSPFHSALRPAIRPSPHRARSNRGTPLQ